MINKSCDLLVRLLPTGMPLSPVAPPMNRQDTTPWGVAAAGPARTSKEGPDMWIRWFEASNSCHWWKRCWVERSTFPTNKALFLIHIKIKNRTHRQLFELVVWLIVKHKGGVGDVMLDDSWIIIPSWLDKNRHCWRHQPSVKNIKVKAHLWRYIYIIHIIQIYNT